MKPLNEIEKFKDPALSPVTATQQCGNLEMTLNETYLLNIFLSHKICQVSRVTYFRLPYKGSEI